MFYLRYLCLFDSSLPLPVCRRIHVLFTLFKHGSSYKQAEVKTNQTNTNNVNKTWILLQTGGGKDGSNKHK
jgi:predicted glycosyltransferase